MEGLSYIDSTAGLDRGVGSWLVVMEGKACESRYRHMGRRGGVL